MAKYNSGNIEHRKNTQSGKNILEKMVIGAGKEITKCNLGKIDMKNLIAQKNIRKKIIKAAGKNGKIEHRKNTQSGKNILEKMVIGAGKEITKCSSEKIENKET